MGGAVSARTGAAVRVLVVDDSAVFREGLIALLATLDQIDVVGEADSGEIGIERAVELQPDVVLMDLNMPGAGGVQATRELLTGSPHIGVLVLTMDEQDESVFAAMQVGARGYLLKGTRQEELVHAILTVSDGGAVFGPAIARRLIAFFTTAQQGAPHTTFPELTRRQREILEFVARGRTNAQIAEQLALSPKTVRNHVSTVFSKLQVADRGAAIIKARDAGLGTR
jgi:DNA-binding NarL/FixJ family response regulator